MTTSLSSIMDNDLVFYGLTIFLFLLISAFFSAAETALTAITRGRLYQLVLDGNKRAKIASNLRREKESLIGAILLGNNAVNIAASAIATSFAIQVFGNNQTGLALVTLVMTLLVVIFSEILPKTYAIQNAEAVALKLAPALNVIVRVLYPITRSIQLVIRYTLKLFGIDITKSRTLISSTDALRGTIALHHREGQMIKQDRDMLGSILDLNEIEVKDVMIHRKQVEMIEADQSAGVFITAAVSTMHSRLPIWKDEPDNLIGVLHTKNLIELMGKRGDKITTDEILALCTKPWFIPETTTLRGQLLAFRNKRQHIAFVVDEYGAWQGIVTLEDIMEEIVGNIYDEHDETDTDIQKIGKDIYSVAGSVTLRDLNRQLDWSLPDEEATTVAGLLIHEMETIPGIGDEFTLHGFRFTVADKKDQQITRLRIEKLPEAKTPEQAR